VLRRIFGPKREGLGEDCLVRGFIICKLTLQKTLQLINERGMIRMRYISCMGEMTNA
jgi:hypothetical protein